MTRRRTFRFDPISIVIFVAGIVCLFVGVAAIAKAAGVL